MATLTYVQLYAEAADSTNDNPRLYSLEMEPRHANRWRITDFLDPTGRDNTDTMPELYKKLPSNLTAQLVGPDKDQIAFTLNAESDLTSFTSLFKEAVKELDATPTIALHFRHGDKYCLLKGEVERYKQWSWLSYPPATPTTCNQALQRLRNHRLCSHATMQRSKSEYYANCEKITFTLNDTASFVVATGTLAKIILDTAFG